MKLEKAYNFFFHPFSPKHSPEVKALSTITVVVLSILTIGGFLIVFGVVNWRDRKVTVQNPKNDKKIQPIAQPRIQQVHLDAAGQKKIRDVKEKNAEQVDLFKKWADEGDWKIFRPSFSHYDWWAFPVDRPSTGYGDKYAVNKSEIEALKADDEFMRNYRKGVELVVKSWGWDLDKDAEISEKTVDQRWTGYGVRLGKMANSLKLFGEDELYRKLQHFFDAVCVPQVDKYPLEDWVFDALGR